MIIQSAACELASEAKATGCLKPNITNLALKPTGIYEHPKLSDHHHTVPGEHHCLAVERIVRIGVEIGLGPAVRMSGSSVRCNRHRCPR